jgi:hypothetical protein
MTEFLFAVAFGGVPHRPVAAAAKELIRPLQFLLGGEFFS